MRPRFSLRWLLILFAVLSVVLYLLFIRPTVNANRFVDEFEESSDAAIGSFGNKTLIQVFENEVNPVRVLIEPRTWHDVWQSQRRIRFQTVRPDPKYAYEAWVDTIQLRATVTGMKYEPGGSCSTFERLVSDSVLNDSH